MPQLVRLRLPSPSLAVLVLLRTSAAIALLSSSCSSTTTTPLPRTARVLRAFYRDCVPSLHDSTRHKGQSGRIAVVGGSREYTGAPFFAARTALRTGADLATVLCAPAAATAIKSYSPELMVLDALADAHGNDDPTLAVAADADADADAVVDGVMARSVTPWLPRLTSLVVGPGLGRRALAQRVVVRLVREARARQLPIVVDGDAVHALAADLEAVRGYALATLTPNFNEFRTLVRSAQLDDHADARALAAALGGVTVVRKGVVDEISDGVTTLLVDAAGAPRRCGGQGDVLAGAIGAMNAWARSSPPSAVARRLHLDDDGDDAGASSTLTAVSAQLAAAVAGSVLVRESARRAFARHARAMSAVDMIDAVPAAFVSVLGD